MKLLALLVAVAALLAWGGVLVTIIGGITIVAIAGGGPLFGIAILLLLLGNAAVWGKREQGGNEMQKRAATMALPSGQHIPAQEEWVELEAWDTLSDEALRRVDEVIEKQGRRWRRQDEQAVG